MRFLLLLLALPLTLQSVYAEEAGRQELSISEKILAQGVPAGAFKLLTDYMHEHHDREYVTEVYGCPTYLKVETKEMVPEPVKKEAKKETGKEAPKAKEAAGAGRDENKETGAKPETKEIGTDSKNSKTAGTSPEAKKEVPPKMVERIKITYKEIPPTGPTAKPCEESKRVKFTKKVKFSSPANVAIIDFSQPSNARRFFLINLQTGKVDKYYTTHGKGSGNTTAYATKFSNIPNSLQTSLGFYVTGEVYQGSYGDTLRLYGLDRSNDNAYSRDIVMHGAWYVGEDFIKSINSATKKPYGRLGVSWGCPAISLSLAPKIISILKEGSVLLHYHPDLMEKALTGREVTVPTPVAVTPAPVTPQPPAAPQAETSSEMKAPQEGASSAPSASSSAAEPALPATPEASAPI